MKYASQGSPLGIKPSDLDLTWWWFTSPKGHWSEFLNGLTACTYEKLFNVSLFLRSNTTLVLGMWLQLGYGLGLELGPVTFQTSDLSDQW